MRQRKVQPDDVDVEHNPLFTFASVKRHYLLYTIILYACATGASEALDYLVEEPLAELVHGTLQLAALALPLLVVPHRLNRGPLPRSGPGVVVHVVVSAPLVQSLLPAGAGGQTGGRRAFSLQQHPH